jgi:RNase adapter protein RapZ
VYDVRSLPNPHFIPQLRLKTGLDAEVQAYVFAQPETQEYWKRLRTFFLFSVTQAMHEGRAFIHVAIGCTAGQHRSVAFVEELAKEVITGVTFIKNHKGLTHENNQKGSPADILRI